MSVLKSCTRCGAELRPNQAEGLCTRCLLESGLEESIQEPDALGRAEVKAQLSQRKGTTASTEERIIRYFGDYELIEEIARGGMGIVYRARQVSLDRTVAVKMLLSGPLSSPEMVKRFRAEASAAASLQHPNIVAIHEVGVHEGQHYFAMDFVDGQSLAKLLAGGALPAKRAAAYLKTIAEAVHYAHERGLLHRDLKPSNVLIDAADQPRVTDFGLARRLEGNSELTLSGQVLGSPNYMPPEQAGAKRGELSRRSDVYALGAMLYHLLTGRPPFVGETIADTLRQVIETEPVSPRLLNPSVPRDLETLCLKSLEKEPAKRYAAAQALVEELNLVLRSEPINARPVSLVEKMWRWCRRRPSLAGLGGATVLLLLVLAIGSPIAAFRIDRERQLAAAAEREQVRLRAEAEMALSLFRPKGAEMLLRSSDAAADLSTLARVVRRFPEHPRLWNAKGLLEGQSGQIEEALRDFTQAIGLAEARADAAAELNDALLQRSLLLKEVGRLAEAGADYCRAKGIPIRDPDAPPSLIDLSLYFNVPLTASLHNMKGSAGNDLGGLPPGRGLFGGVEFDVRGIVSLNGLELWSPVDLPRAVTNVPIHSRFAKLHCFMGTGWRENEGTQIGRFVFHYAGGQTEELPICYAIHVRDCIAQPKQGELEDNPLERAVVAWTGQNRNALSLDGHLRLYMTTWDNPHPDLEVMSTDFVSSMTHCAPFLIAMTVE